ncbi:hypothetical protein L2E82_32292 [Cichorium intybus]|uniref:Uncharacterized protein n=1 Tax=Cichorium intybus TaxID=13427 RepID=A0ACB9BHM2_CICIN|nr:hypothetical protein L2E82_32292 [Cichorium intybus]
MTEGLDMTLDDIIKNNKKSGGTDTNTRSKGGGRGRGGGRGFESGPGPNRRFDNRATHRMNPYFVPQAIHMQKMLTGGESNSQDGTKLYISNLDEGVTNEDIKVLFSDVGELKRYSVHYDRSGRSKGTAEVAYMRQSDAVAAMKRYNNVQLDGKPMKLELVGLNIMTPVPMQPMHKGILGNPINASQRIGGRIVGRGQNRGRGGGGGGGGGGGRHGLGRSGGGHPKKVSAEELDADLEKYRLEALHIK